MIFAVIGGVGSGKSVTATKKILNSNYHCFANFNIKTHNATRLKKEHIVKETVIRTKKNGEDVTKAEINWGFWNRAKNKHQNFHLMLDEVHNIFHARQAMKKWNVLGSMWISQIRKVLGNSEKTHIYLVSQRLSRIDVAFRDLLHGITFCSCSKLNHIQVRTRVWEKNKLVIKILPLHIVLLTHFVGDDCCERFEAFMFGGAKSYTSRTWYVANPYFQYYDTYEMLGESAYL